MKANLSTDGHVHTSLCGHATGTMEEYVRAAIDKGLHTITFLEHLEAGIAYAPKTWLTDEDFSFYFAEGERLRSIYGDRLKIGLGVEVGFNPDQVELILQRLARHPWDRVGLSYHFHRLPGTPHHLNLLSQKRKNLEIMERYDSALLLSHYFDMLLAAVEQIPADVLCHLDAGLRHLPGRRFTADHRQQIERILLAVKAHGMALEINTSGYDITGQPFPPPDIIAQARQIGIPVVPGSDAHRPADVARYFDRLEALLTAIPGPSPFSATRR